MTDSFLPLDRLEHELYHPREDWTEDTLVELYFGTEVRGLSLMHVGGDGWLKTLDFVPRNAAHLRSILRAGERADGSSLFDGSGIAVDDSDIVLRPRIQSAFIDPFAQQRTLVVLCGHAGPLGNPLSQSPDTIVRNASRRLREESGLELLALGEVEFFLGRRPGEQEVYGAAERGYHASAPFVFGQEIRRRALAILAGIGVPVKYGHSEVGYIPSEEAGGLIWEQHEIELALQPLPQAADSIVLTQWVLRNLAQRHGMHCSTDPVMRSGHAGNGLHIHFSVLRQGRHEPVLSAAGRLSESAGWLVGGLVTGGAALMAFGNRVPGSFLRLTHGKEAPASIRWSRRDRRALVRIPLVATDEGGWAAGPQTLEFRLPDGSALPHLLLAGAVQAMLHARTADDLALVLARTGTEAGADPSSGLIPRNFVEVADAVARHRSWLEAGDVFPPALLDRICANLRG